MVSSPFKGMWLIAMFDLPMDTPRRRKAYARFRSSLLRDGFTRLQLSVYARYCSSEEASHIHRKRIRQALPAEGQVRVVLLTDHQFGKMEVYVGKKRGKPEHAPLQLELF